MAPYLKLGLLTPSSNTIMEPQAAAVVAGLDNVSVHFGRFRVTEISMSGDALGQFNFGPQLAAAELLGDARMNVIAWGGTSGSWLGRANDEELCRQITARCGVPATTSTLALFAAFEALNVKSYGLVTPYLSEIQEQILKNFADEGYSCTGDRRLEDRGNYSFAEYEEATIAGMVREVAAGKPDAIAIQCTNFNGTRIAPALEEELGIPVLDSVAFTIWHSLNLAGFDPRRVKGWGRLFQEGGA